jgi:hypothetical protein
MECTASQLVMTSFTDSNCVGTVVTQDYGGCEADAPGSWTITCAGNTPSYQYFEGAGCTGNSYTGAYPFGTACASKVLFLQPVPLTFACGDSFESN